MQAALITIGDEILIGQVINTNAAFLSTALYSVGIPVTRIVTVSDDEKDIIAELKNSIKTCDLIIITGGLGPTHDDITKQCIARFFNSKLVLHKPTLERVKKIFRRRRMAMPEVNIGQAMIPENSKVVQNPIGTAPGIHIEKNGVTLFALPGVPYEMKKMTETTVVPYLRKKSRKGARVIKHKTLHTIGISESLLFESVGDISKITGYHNKANIRLAFLPSNYETRLRISVEAKNETDADKAIKDTENKLIGKAGKYIYSRDESTISETIGKLLKKNRKTLAVAESCTGGLIASKITDAAGSSDYFLESVTSYSNSSKIRMLGVKTSTIKKYGAVSKQTAMEMAEGIRKVSGADIGVSTTGIAGPSGATKAKPLGLVWIGYSDKKTTFAKEFIFAKERLRNKEIMSKMALEIIRRKLIKLI